MFHPKRISHHHHQVVHELLLGVNIGLKARRAAFSIIQIGIGISQSLKQKRRFAICRIGFERVAFHHQKCTAIVFGNEHGFIQEQIVVDVASPLCHRFAHRRIGGNHRNHGIIRFFAASAHIHAHHIAAFGFGILPNFEPPGALIHQMRVSILANDFAGKNRVEALAAHGIEPTERKHAPAGGGKGFNGIGGKFRHHAVMRLIAFSLFVIPFYHLQSATFIPQVALIIVHTFPQCFHFFVGHRHAIDFNLIPRDKHGFFIRFPFGGIQPLFVEKRPYAIGGGFEHLHRESAHQNRAIDGAHHIFRLSLSGRRPKCHLAQVRHSNIVAAHHIFHLGGAHHHEAIATGDDFGVGVAFKRFEFHFFTLFKQFFRIMAKEFGIHSLNHT